MKLNILLFTFILLSTSINAQDIDYNNLTTEHKDVANQAFNKVNPSTKKWFADMAGQHPDGTFNVPWAKEKLNSKFSVKDMDLMGELFALMMAYQRMVNKEAREDRKLARADKQVELNTKANKLEIDNAKIDQQKKEAAEKQDNAMQAANSELVSGTVSAGTQVLAGSRSGDTLRQARDFKDINSAYIIKKDSSKSLQQKANLQDQRIKQQQLREEKSGDQKKASEDHRKAQKDAIRKLLDQLAELNRSTHIK